MKIQMNFGNNTNCCTGQSFMAVKNVSYLKSLSKLPPDCKLLTPFSGNLKDSNFEKFLNSFVSKYINRRKAEWEYATKHTLWAGFKSKIMHFDYEYFINNGKNREYYNKLHADKKYKSLSERLVDFLKWLPVDILCHRTSDKISKISDRIDGKKVNINNLINIITFERDPELRKKACDAQSEIGDSLKNNIVSIVKKRNSLAEDSKHSYFDSLLSKNYNIDAGTFNNNFNSLYLELKPNIDEAIKEHDDELKKIFQTDQLEYYHYDLDLGSNEYEILNESLNKTGVLPLVKEIYSKMGFNLDELIKEKKLILYQDKNKRYPFHSALIEGEQSGVCVGETGNFKTLLAFCHELAHAMHNLGSPGIFSSDIGKQPSRVIKETIALMFQNIVLKENLLSDIVPSVIHAKIKKNYNNEWLIKMAKLFAINEFEQEMYLNPNQDLAKLWQEKLKKFTGRNYAVSNNWATMDYFADSVADVHNYIKAMVLADKLYEHLKSKLGNLTENKGTAKYLNENIFSKWASLTESELLNEITANEHTTGDFDKVV